MGSPSEIGGLNQSKSEIIESQLIKIKLRINIVIVSREKGKQEKLASQFREGKIDDIQLQDELADELAAGTVSYVDEDEGEYVCYDKTLVADETSPRAMEAMATAIDNYIKSYCINPDVSEVVVCLLLPSISIDGKIPLAFLNTYWIPSIQKMVAMPKIAIQKSVILLYGIQKIIKKSINLAVDVAELGVDVAVGSAKEMVNVAAGIKDEFTDKVEQAKDMAEDVVEQVKDTVADTIVRAKDMAVDTVEKTRDVAEDVVEKAKDTAADIKRKTVEVINSWRPKDEMSKTEIQIAALMSYYIYFYLDLYENDNWRFFGKDSMYKEKNVEKYVEERAEEKYTPKPKGFWKKTLNYSKMAISLPQILGNVTKGFLFGYGAKLENRVYSRIADVYDLTLEDKGVGNQMDTNANANANEQANKNKDAVKNEQAKKKKNVDANEQTNKDADTNGQTNIKREGYIKGLKEIIMNVLAIPKDSEKQENQNKQRSVVNLHDFFDRCKYWKYLGNDTLEMESKNWCCLEDRIKDKDGKDVENEWKPKAYTGFVSGFGGMIFRHRESGNGIFVFKGTDFDSIVRDWLLGNFLQGLTGCSPQYIESIIYAKLYDKQFAGKKLFFAGHSLGGGLASAAVLATKNRTGVTFNAAGLNVIGSKVTQLYSNPLRTVLPYKDWLRVTPYRIRGEILDRGQQILGWSAVPILERGYGLSSVELDITGIHESTCERHGIINFLYKDVLGSLTTYAETESLERTGLHNINTKIKEIKINGKLLSAQGLG